MPCRVQWLVLLLSVGMCPSVVRAEGDAPMDAGQVCAWLKSWRGTISARSVGTAPRSRRTEACD